MYLSVLTRIFFSPIQDKDMLLLRKPDNKKEEPSSSTEGLILESAGDGLNTVTNKKSNKKNKGKSTQNNDKSNDDKENVIMTQSEVCNLHHPVFIF